MTKTLKNNHLKKNNSTLMLTIQTLYVILHAKINDYGNKSKSKH